ncbi:MAG: squalene/phytoene synthase family protein [Pseudomonadota bacterium]
MPPISSFAFTPDPALPLLLKSVSRSFDLSIRLLPAGVREPVSVAYLLARAADTLADTANVPAPERSRRLATWAAAVDGRLEDAPAEVKRLGESFAPMQADPRERALILALPQCLDALAALPPLDQADVRTVLRHITRGQMLDVDRFTNPALLTSLANANELDEYTYLVAGCVGEFWTSVCVRHLPHFAERPPSEMRALGREYGKALQLVNILRDAAADAGAGRSYMPADEVESLGLAAVRARWLEKAHEGLASGMHYAQAVNNRRVRAASALPALLGVRTLALLHTAKETKTPPAKVPRSEVRALLLRMAITLAARGPLKRMFDAASPAA